jgi:hypothetical protein
MTQTGREGDRPRVEPEIIPPDARRDPRASFDGRNTQRIYVARVSPFGFAMAALVVAMLVALVILLVVGAFVVMLPVVVVLLAIALVYSIFRRTFGRSY